MKEPSVEDIIRDNPEGDLKRLLRARDQAWREKVEKKLMDNFNASRDKLNNKQQSAEPMKLLKKAFDALSAIDTNQPSFKADLEIKEYLKKIITIATNYSEVNNS